MTQALVIGAGPAGLMAAEEMGRAGIRVTVAEAKPSPARKFLMAGKSGLNLTKDEIFGKFLAAYGDAEPHLRPMLDAFGPDEVMGWAEGLGQPLFTGSTGRVFPKAMKASPLLRAWLARLDGYGVELRRNWHWEGWENGQTLFRTPEGEVSLTPQVTVLACGGASWARLGSDGEWAAYLEDHVAPFQPSNMGVSMLWSDYMVPYFGSPLKNIRLSAGNMTTRGECVISGAGLEGGGIYALSPALRAGEPLVIDLLPDLTERQVRERMARPKGKSSRGTHLRKALKLDPAKRALLMECARAEPDDMASTIKALPVPHMGPRDIDEAISTAGGLRFDALDDQLMLKHCPGVFAAGEMLDWEAPTGGYLLTACLATGRWAGQGAVNYLKSSGQR